MPWYVYGGQRAALEVVFYIVWKKDFLSISATELSMAGKLLVILGDSPVCIPRSTRESGDFKYILLYLTSYVVLGIWTQVQVV